jgi:hypothetical protein
MNYASIPEKPLIAGVSNKNLLANQVFFFERSDGEVIAVEEHEAWGLYARRPQVLGSKKHEFKLIGVGSGEIYNKAIMEAKELGQTDIKKAQERLRQGFKEELEACRGKIIVPRNVDKMGDAI